MIDTNPLAPPSQKFILTYDTDTGAESGRLMLVATSADGYVFEAQPDLAKGLGVNFADTQTVLYFNRDTNLYEVGVLIIIKTK